MLDQLKKRKQKDENNNLIEGLRTRGNVRQLNASASAV